MSIFDRFRTLKKVTLNNTEPNTEQEIGVQGVDDNTDCHSVDWHDKLPDLVRPSIINLRKCGATPLVSGILHDFVMKSISGYEIVGDDLSGSRVYQCIIDFPFFFINITVFCAV